MLTFWPADVRVPRHFKDRVLIVSFIIAAIHEFMRKTFGIYVQVNTRFKNVYLLGIFYLHDLRCEKYLLDKLNSCSFRHRKTPQQTKDVGLSSTTLDNVIPTLIQRFVSAGSAFFSYLGQNLAD